jgi:hypothetical protein
MPNCLIDGGSAPRHFLRKPRYSGLSQKNLVFTLASMVADDPSCLANPILAFTSAASAASACGRRRRWQRLVATASGILLLLLTSYTYLGPAADLPVLEGIAAYTYEQPSPFSHNLQHTPTSNYPHFHTTRRRSRTGTEMGDIRTCFHGHRPHWTV